MVGRGTWARARANTDPNQPRAAAWIRALRKRTGLSQGEFGRRLGVSLFTVYRWERVGGQYPRQYHVARLGLLEKKLDGKEKG